MADEDQSTRSAETDDMYEHYRFVADPKQSLIRIDKFLLDRLERVSRNKVQNAIRAGSVLVDGERVKPNYKIKPGNEITILLPEPVKEGTLIPEDIPLDIRYEDDDVMIIHKPSGLVVHPGIGIHSGTLVNALAYYFKDKELPFMPGNISNRPGLVHRIDKNTSGLMVIAKTDLALTQLAKQFFEHTIERKYIALVWGEFEEEEGTITGHIGRHPRHRLQRTVFENGEEGKHAVTHFKVLENMYYVSLVECQLETGRTHQIRVHMKYRGHPLFNDERYGGNRIVKGTVFNKYRQFVHNCFDLIPRQALHAKSLGFIHPRSGERLFFDSDLPPDFDSVLKKWRAYVQGRKELL
ncbi:MAG: RluA family pseudouridine synthase [Bacteroidota bacterium]